MGLELIMAVKELNIKVILKILDLMDLENFNFLDIDIKEIIKTGICMVKVLSIFQMEIENRDNGKTINNTENLFIITKTDPQNK